MDSVICFLCTKCAPQCSLCATEPSTITHDAVRATTPRTSSGIYTLLCSRSVLANTPQEAAKTLSATPTPTAPRPSPTSMRRQQSLSVHNASPNHVGAAQCILTQNTRWTAPASLRRRIPLSGGYRAHLFSLLLACYTVHQHIVPTGTQ